MTLKKQISVLVILVFAAVLGLVPILTALGGKTEYSLFENRSLAARPELTWESLWSGEYSTAWDDYLSDHVFMRNLWMRLHTASEMYLLRRNVVNDVVITDTVLLEYFPPDSRSYEFSHQARLMAAGYKELDLRVRAYEGVFLYVGVPEQGSMFRDSYPHYLNNNEQLFSAIESAFFTAMEEAGIQSLNMREVFTSQEDFGKYYTRSDHHFNLLGAVETCLQIEGRLKDMGREINFLLPREGEIRQLPNPFSGSRGRKLYNMSTITDKLMVWDKQVDFLRWDNGEPAPATVITLPADNREPVSYASYMNGDVGETVIQTDRPELPNVLIFGDSFTNAIEALAYTGFNEMRSLDLRLYTGMGILQYIDSYKPDVVLCVGNDTYYLVQEGNGLIS